MSFLFLNTGNDRYSGHGYSGIDRYSGTKNPDDAILFTNSGITISVELFEKILTQNWDFEAHKDTKNSFFFKQGKKFSKTKI